MLVSQEIQRIDVLFACLEGIRETSERDLDKTNELIFASMDLIPYFKNEGEVF
jgi:hypothetical protein